MKIPKPIPLYPAYTQLQDVVLTDYPELNVFLNSGPCWWMKHWQWGLDFLKYIGRNKSEHTFIRFRNETERFLLWAFLAKAEPIDGYRKTDILEYADYCWRPPVSWICLVNRDRFEFRSGAYHTNKAWAPYRLKQAKKEKMDRPDKKKYRPSQQTLTAIFTAVIAFYKYMMYEEVCVGNPAQIAKKDCRYFIADAQVKEIRRLTEDQWQYALDAVTELADNDSRYERSLFLIAALKTLFLRISELSERTDWSPVMSHFWEDENGSWWLKIYGKGRKLRDITVPTQFLSYLERYRTQRGLSALPYPGDNSSLVEKIRGQGGMTSRHLTRLIQEVFDMAYDRMKRIEGVSKARKLKEASTHWLRHTGASMEIERGRALKDLSEDLGHASMATTDTVYVQTENKKRAESGKSRTVE
jgi:site-specific recombinase XerD